MTENTDMKNNELKNLIIRGLKYIGFIEVDEKTPDVNVNLIINIRKYLLKQTYEWYKEKFPTAYDFDMGITRKDNDIYYSDDGLKYIFDENMYLINCYLYNDRNKEKHSFEPPIQFSYHLTEPKKTKKYDEEISDYYYINEIDHFFTTCINSLLKGGDRFSGKEKGIKYIKKTIEEWEK